jgi:NAD+ synthase
MIAMRNYEQEMRERVAFIRQTLADAGAEGIVFGSSGGKDSTLVGILCRVACDNVLGVIMPCGSKRNYGIDREDALAVARRYDIPLVTADLTAARDTLLAAVAKAGPLSDMAVANMAPRLRMNTLYALAHSRKSLVAGTGNRSEAYMGYFTKWGDGAYDFNPIGDLTVREIYEFLRYLEAPAAIIEKAPSAGLYEGQTDEGEMGVTYETIDDFLLEGKVQPEILAVLERYHRQSRHKRELPLTYGG